MPTYENPVADAGEAAEALRGLAHASRMFSDPGDSYRVLGSLSMTLASLQQSLSQLADFHQNNALRAATDEGERVAGRGDALAATRYLRTAADRVQQSREALNDAFKHNGRIAWQPEPGIDANLTRPGADRDGSGRLAPPSAFGTGPVSREGPHSLGR